MNKEKIIFQVHYTGIVIFIETRPLFAGFRRRKSVFETQSSARVR